MIEEINSDIYLNQFKRREDIENFIKEEFLDKKDKYPEHEHLNYATLHVYSVETLTGKHYERYGKLKYIRDDLVYNLCQVDFVILLNDEVWGAMLTERRRALIDHFLQRIVALYEWEDQETGKRVKGEFYDIPLDPGINLRFQVSKSGRYRWKIRNPIGEFPAVLKRYGTWNTDVKDMISSFKEGEKNVESRPSVKTDEN
jgi:hypothetical protein